MTLIQCLDRQSVVTRPQVSSRLQQNSPLKLGSWAELASTCHDSLFVSNLDVCLFPQLHHTLWPGLFEGLKREAVECEALAWSSMKAAYDAYETRRNRDRESDRTAHSKEPPAKLSEPPALQPHSQTLPPKQSAPTLPNPATQLKLLQPSKPSQLRWEPKPPLVAWPCQQQMEWKDVMRDHMYPVGGFGTDGIQIYWKRKFTVRPSTLLSFFVDCLKTHSETKTSSMYR